MTFSGRKLAIAALCATSAWVAAAYVPAALNAVGGWVVAADHPEPADLIVVLGGDFFGLRVLEGAELGREGYATHVLMSGPPYQGRPQGDAAIDFAVKRGYPRELFRTAANDADSTLDEARALGKIFRRERARTVLLVTSRYHTRRAGLLFRALYPEIRFRTVAPRWDGFSTTDWWKHPEAREIVRSEWLKLAWNLGIRMPAVQWARLASTICLPLVLP